MCQSARLPGSQLWYVSSQLQSKTTQHANPHSHVTKCARPSVPALIRRSARAKQHNTHFPTHMWQSCLQVEWRIFLDIFRFFVSEVHCELYTFLSIPHCAVWASNCWAVIAPSYFPCGWPTLLSSYGFFWHIPRLLVAVRLVRGRPRDLFRTVVAHLNHSDHTVWNWSVWTRIWI